MDNVAAESCLIIIALEETFSTVHPVKSCRDDDTATTDCLDAGFDT